MTGRKSEAGYFCLASVILHLKSEPMSYLMPFIAALLLSFLLTGVLRPLALRFNWVSIPRERDIHKTPLPRIGGIAIFISFILVSLFAFLYYRIPLNLGEITHNHSLLGIWLGGLVITSAMFFDDIKGLRAWQKLLVQILVSLIIIASGVGIDSLANPFGAEINLNTIYIPIFTYHGIVYHFSLLSDILTLVWMVVMMNVLNFVDGVDGLAGGVSSIAALTIFFLSISLGINQPATAVLSIILAGSALGFLIWNFPPARIFMGDSGSMFLGFMLGVLPLISGGKLATVFLVLGFPIVDGFFVIFGRIFRKQKITTPDKTHLHHRFLEAGFTPRQAVLTIYLVAAAFGWVALRSTTLDKLIASVILIALVASLIVTLSYVKKRRE